MEIEMTESSPLVKNNKPIVCAKFKRLSDAASFSNPEFTLELSPGIELQ